VRELPSPESRLRLPALVEMVKIDLERQWQLGRRISLEEYLKLYPELGAPETVSADLIQAEFKVRRQFGTPSDQGQQSRKSTVPPGPAHSTPSVAPPASDSRELPKGKMFGRYRIDDKLGAGGMGTVYLAHDTQLDGQEFRLYVDENSVGQNP
jgi:hypothetical protein